jgi:hypothetical protein
MRAHHGIGSLVTKPATPPIVHVPSGAGWSGVSVSAAQTRPNVAMKSAKDNVRIRGQDSGSAAKTPIAANTKPSTATRG